ncbi:hypothetical protein BBP40_001990 [Aspergillus hancockii]|nr:hypothetical protein BBP40_001990 [Aspergillus hancockii]
MAATMYRHSLSNSTIQVRMESIFVLFSMYCDTIWIIHTNLKQTNILLQLETLDRAISQYLSEVSPRTHSRDGITIPLREVIRTPFVSEMKESHIRILDFSVDLIQPPTLGAPEVSIGAPWDTAVYIWSLGCLVIELVQGIVLFSGEVSENGPWTAEDDRLAEIFEVVGPFALQFLKTGTRTAQSFDKKGDLLRILNLKPTSLERLINGTKPFLKPKDMSDAEVPIFLDFLRGMLQTNPELRNSATDLLQYE